jgi:hypothetical protein
LPVGEGDRLVGVITDRDIAIRAVAEGKAPTTKVGDLMSHEVLYCFDDQDLDEIAQNMAEMKVRRLPVVNRDKRLVGIISLGDLARERGFTHRGSDDLRNLGAWRRALSIGALTPLPIEPNGHASTACPFCLRPRRSKAHRARIRLEFQHEIAADHRVRRHGREAFDEVRHRGCRTGHAMRVSATGPIPNASPVRVYVALPRLQSARTLTVPPGRNSSV